MKKYIIIFLIMCMLIPISSASYWDYLTKPYADTLYCARNGNCNISSLTVQNLTVEGSYFNVSVVDFNVTNNIYAQGNVSADYFKGHDSQTATLIVAASNSLYPDVADFVCDGVADQVEIEAALNALPSGGGKVVLMEGTFYLASTITIPKDNVVLVGQGPSTILKTHSTGETIRLQNRNNIVIRDIKFIGINQAFSYGIRLNEVIENVWVLNNVFFNYTDGGIFKSGFPPGTTRSITIKDNLFEHTEDPIVFVGTEDSVVTGNIAKHCTGSFIDVPSDSSRNIISNNIIYNQTGVYGVDIQGPNNIISGNLIRKVAGYCIFVTNDNNLITNNNIIDCDRNALSVGDALSSKNSIVSQNRIDPENSTINSIFIGVESTGTMVLNNQLIGTTLKTIQDSGENSTIIGNFPGGSSMEIQTAEGQEIKMIPEGVLTAILTPNFYNITGDLNASGVICDKNGCISSLLGNFSFWINNSPYLIPREPNINVSGNLTAGMFIGNGSGLTDTIKINYPIIDGDANSILYVNSAGNLDTQGELQYNGAGDLTLNAGGIINSRFLIGGNNDWSMQTGVASDLDFIDITGSKVILRLKTDGTVGNSTHRYTWDDLNATGSSGASTIWERLGTNVSLLNAGDYFGLGINHPERLFHINFSGPTGVRFERHDLPIVWDLDFDSQNLNFRDVTNNLRPFIIYDGAPDNSFVVENGGDIGLGIFNPSHHLHINRTGASFIRLQRTDIPTDWRIDLDNGYFNLKDDLNNNQIIIDNQGYLGLGEVTNPVEDIHISAPTPAIRLENNNTGQSFAFLVTAADDFTINDVNTGSVPFVVRDGIPYNDLFVMENGNFRLNEFNSDTDFNIEGTNTNDNLLNIDAGNNKVTIGGTGNLAAKLFVHNQFDATKKVLLLKMNSTQLADPLQLTDHVNSVKFGVAPSGNIGVGTQPSGIAMLTLQRNLLLPLAAIDLGTYASSSSHVGITQGLTMDTGSPILQGNKATLLSVFKSTGTMYGTNMETTIFNANGTYINYRAHDVFTGGEDPERYHFYSSMKPSSINPTNNQIGYYYYTLETGSDNNMKKWSWYNDGTTVAGKMFMGKDNVKSYWGTGYNANIYYNSTDLVIKADEVGSASIVLDSNTMVNGDLDVIGNLTGNVIYGDLNTGGNATITPNIFTILTGTLDSGNISSVQYIDGQTISISEVVGSPGFDLFFNFTGFPSNPRRVEFVGRYDGGAAHEVEIKIFNYSSQTYVDINDNPTDIPDSESNQFLSFIIDGNTSDYLNSGEVSLQLIHSDAGNVNHDFFIDFISLTPSSQDLTNVGEFVKINNYDTAKGNGVVIDKINGNMTIQVNGDYRIETTSSFASLGDSFLQCSVFKNGIEDIQLRFIRKLNTAGDIGSASFGGIISDLIINDVLDLRCASQIEDSFVTFANLDFYIERKGD